MSINAINYIEVVLVEEYPHSKYFAKFYGNNQATFLMWCANVVHSIFKMIPLSTKYSILF